MGGGEHLYIYFCKSSDGKNAGGGDGNPYLIFLIHSFNCYEREI